MRQGKQAEKEDFFIGGKKIDGTVTTIFFSCDETIKKGIFENCIRFF
jgi:hypothetical protein